MMGPSIINQGGGGGDPALEGRVAAVENSVAGINGKEIRFGNFDGRDTAFGDLAELELRGFDAAAVDRPEGGKSLTIRPKVQDVVYGSLTGTVSGLTPSTVLSDPGISDSFVWLENWDLGLYVDFNYSAWPGMTVAALLESMALGISRKPTASEFFAWPRLDDDGRVVIPVKGTESVAPIGVSDAVSAAIGFETPNFVPAERQTALSHELDAVRSVYGSLTSTVSGMSENDVIPAHIAGVDLYFNRGTRDEFYYESLPLTVTEGDTLAVLMQNVTSALHNLYPGYFGTAHLDANGRFVLPVESEEVLDAGFETELPEIGLTNGPFVGSQTTSSAVNALRRADDSLDVDGVHVLATSGTALDEAETLDFYGVVNDDAFTFEITLASADGRVFSPLGYPIGGTDTRTVFASSASMSLGLFLGDVMSEISSAASTLFPDSFPQSSYRVENGRASVTLEVDSSVAKIVSIRVSGAVAEALGFVSSSSPVPQVVHDDMTALRVRLDTIESRLATLEGGV